jgi:hypothetical protein
MSLSTELLSTNLVVLISIISIVCIAIFGLALFLLIKIYRNTKNKDM